VPEYLCRMSLVEALTDFLAGLAAELGPAGFFAVMFLESIIVPVPSEVVLVTAGLAAGRSSASLLGFFVAATLGSLAGAMTIYTLARVLGVKLVEKYGRYLGVRESHLKAAAAFFEKYGALSVFLARFVPGVRSLIGIPAGIVGMDPRLYALAAGAGGAIWNAAFILLGVVVEGSLSAAKHYSAYIDAAGAAALLILAALALRKVKLNRAAQKVLTSSTLQ